MFSHLNQGFIWCCLSWLTLDRAVEGCLPQLRIRIIFTVSDTMWTSVYMCEWCCCCSIVNSLIASSIAQVARCLPIHYTINGYWLTVFANSQLNSRYTVCRCAFNRLYSIAPETYIASICSSVKSPCQKNTHIFTIIRYTRNVGGGESTPFELYMENNRTHNSISSNNNIWAWNPSYCAWLRSVYTYRGFHLSNSTKR